MATQNIIQYLETSQYNALPIGGTVPVGIEAMNRRQIETFIASEAIAVGDTVALDFSKAGSGDKGIFVVKCDQGTATKKCGVGVAISAATAAGDTVDAVIAGMVDNAKVAGAKEVPLPHNSKHISGYFPECNQYTLAYYTMVVMNVMLQPAE